MGALDVLRAARRREWAAVAGLQAGRVLALARLLRLHGPGRANLARLDRALRQVAATEVRFAHIWLCEFILQRSHPQLDLAVQAPPEAFAPLSIIQHLADAGRSKHGALRLTLTGEYLEALLHVEAPRRELERALALSWRPAGAAGVMVDATRLEAGAVRLLTPQGHVRRRVEAARVEAAEALGEDASSLVPSSRDGATSVVVGRRTVRKVRLRFLSTTKPGTLADEWAALTLLRAHPAVCRAHGYDARPDWELLTMERIVGTPLGEVARNTGPHDPMARRCLLRLADVTTFMEAVGVEHRDFADDNILVHDDEHLTVVDFDQAVAVHPRDHVPDVAVLAYARPLVPWYDHGDLVRRIGWQPALEAMSRALTDAWMSVARPRFSLRLWNLELPGSLPLWPRWHALVAAQHAFRRRSVALVGDDTGLLGVLLLLAGASDVVFPQDTPSAERLAHFFGLADRVQVARPRDGAPRADVVVALGLSSEGQRELVGRLLARSDAAVVEAAGPPDATAQWLSAQGLDRTRALPAPGVAMIEGRRAT